MGNTNKFGNTYGLSTVFLESLGINGPLVSKVFVANVSMELCKFVSFCTKKKGRVQIRPLFICPLHCLTSYSRKGSWV